MVPFYHITRLKSKNSLIFDLLLIADTLAQHAFVSSDLIYNDSFLSHKKQTEESRISFDCPSNPSHFSTYNTTVSPGQNNINA